MNEKIVPVYRWLVTLSIFFIITSCQKETGFRLLPESVMLFIASPPSVQMDSAISRTLPVQLYGTLLSSGSDSLKRYGFCFSSLKQLPTIADTTTVVALRLSTFPAKFVLSSSGLLRNKLYYVRAFAENRQGVAYSEGTVTFLVPDNRSLPAVTTSDIENISAASANIKASIDSDGQSAITAYGFVYSTTHQDPDLADQVSITGTSLSVATPYAYAQLLQALSNNSTYYVRAFATNSIGTAYGERKSFRTTSTATVAPTVQTDNVFNLTTTTATIDGVITSKGSAEITSYGFCYSATNANPTTADVSKASGTTVTAFPFSFSSSLSALTENTNYFVRAFATSSAGTSYGVVRNFRTLTTAVTLPIVQTSEVTSTSITTTTAMAKGMLQSTGSAAITRYGFCYSSTQTNPTIADPLLVAGTANPATLPATFAGNLTNLSPATTYNLRAFATSSAGTAYGTTISFKTITPAVASPSVQTVNVSGISYASASVFNNLVASGSSSITSYGVVYSSTNTTPTIADSKVISGSSSPATFPSAYTSSLTGLTTNTAYSVRAFASNSVGTTYGEVKRFATLAAVPSITTDQVTFSQADGSVTARATIQVAGASAITRYGVCYSSTNANPTVTDNASDAGASVSGSFPFSFTKTTFRLTAANYYFRAYAFNSYGVAYGNVVTVTVFSAPSVTTEGASEKNAEAGLETLLASITSSGSSPILEYGFCYTKSSNVGRIGFGVGEANIAVVKQMSPSPSSYPFRYQNDVTVAYNTDYSYRAYVKTVNGYFYGDIKTFSISYKP